MDTQNSNVQWHRSETSSLFHNDQAINIINLSQQMFLINDPNPIPSKPSKNQSLPAFQLNPHPNPLYHTPLIPITCLLNYRLRIKVRRVSNDNIETGKLMVGAAFKDKEGRWMQVTRRFAYFQFELQGSKLKKDWQLFEFKLGNSQNIKICNDAKFMCICVLINWKGGAAVFEACEGEIIQI